MVILEIQRSICAHCQWLISVSWRQVSSCPVRIFSVGVLTVSTSLAFDAAMCPFFFFSSTYCLPESVYTQLYSLLVILQYVIHRWCSFLICYITKKVDLQDGYLSIATYLYVCPKQINFLQHSTCKMVIILQ